MNCPDSGRVWLFCRFLGTSCVLWWRWSSFCTARTSSTGTWSPRTSCWTTGWTSNSPTSALPCKPSRDRGSKVSDTETNQRTLCSSNVSEYNSGPFHNWHVYIQVVQVTQKSLTVKYSEQKFPPVYSDIQYVWGHLESPYFSRRGRKPLKTLFMWAQLKTVMLVREAIKLAILWATSLKNINIYNKNHYY